MKDKPKSMVIRVTKKDGESMTVDVNNKGFSPFEIIGIAELLKQRAIRPMIDEAGGWKDVHDG